MKENGLCFVVACLASAALVLAACSPPVSTLSPSTTTRPPKGANPPTESAAADGPEYGGALTVLTGLTDMGIFDPVATGQFIGSANAWLVNQQYLGHDWTKGPAGSGVVDWPSGVISSDSFRGILAESWEVPALGTIVFKVRRGVHWALNSGSEAGRLMNGKEVTADDWIANFTYLMQNPRSPLKVYASQVAATATMEKTGQWEVTVKTPVSPLIGWNWLGWGYAWYFLLPPEVVKKYGDMQDWHNVVGTGPFMLTDFVANSSATLVKNPGYWETDPVGPGKGNQLPYVNGIKILVVPDISTRLAALRTGKIDMIPDVEAEDAKGLIRANPALRYRTFLTIFPYVVSMKTDKAELPYKDKRVRQALMMATDFAALKNDLYRGEAETLVFPVSSAFKRAYAPLEEMPEVVKELFRYNPDKAKQLLAEAGYPGGFKAKMIVQNVPSDINLASAYKAMWSRVGVDLEIQPREVSVYSSINYARSWQEMLLTIAQTGFPQYLNFVGLRVFNDAIIESAFQEVQRNVIVNQSEADRLYRQVMPHIVERAYYIPRPSPNLYSLWWPWVKNHYGDQSFYFLQYAWIDQDLKEQIAGRR